MPSIVYFGANAAVQIQPLGVFERGVPRQVDEAEMIATFGHPIDGTFPRNASFALVVRVPEVEDYDSFGALDALIDALAAAPQAAQSLPPAEETDTDQIAPPAQEEEHNP